MTLTAQYGTWKSPITSELIVAGTVGLTDIAAHGDDIYWVESRPMERGRNVIVRCDAAGHISDITPAPYNARTRVHEYGGAPYMVQGEEVFFSNDADGRIYRQALGGAPRPITPPAPMRYADMHFDAARNRILCVREDHSSSDQEAVAAIVSIDPDGASPTEVLVSGNDFYASPCLSADGRSLAWLTWNHPNMPWDGTELWVAPVMDDGGLGPAHRVAGGERESIFQPQWSPDGRLYFVSDRTGWWNLYRWEGDRVRHLLDMPAEFGVPQWAFGMSTYAFLSRDVLLCAYTQNGLWHLAVFEPDAGAFRPLDLPFTDINNVRTARGRGVFRAGSPTQPFSVVLLEPDTGRCEILRRSSDRTPDEGYLSEPTPIAYPSAGGAEAYALFYPPRNRDVVAPAEERPPLLVKSHGGPTSMASTALNLSTQYWTSRGFAVLDVNYGGSTGFGRPYRERLKGQWGIVDVDDCVHGALFLAGSDQVDSQQLLITGGSAGGFTTLCALTFRDVFRAGASHFGVADLEALARDTHKFESRYLDGLVGPYPARRDIYLARSPIYHVEKLHRPVIFFQGLEDPIVPPDQTRRMAAALKERGIPVACLYFEGEQHGFRQAEHIRRSLEAELYFYGRVLGFTPADAIAPVPIENEDNLGNI